MNISRHGLETGSGIHMATWQPLPMGEVAMSLITLDEPYLGTENR
jgi:hypothetical protein